MAAALAASDSAKAETTFSAPHLVLRGIAGEVEDLHFVDAGEAGVVGELADDLLLLVEFEELGGGGVLLSRAQIHPRQFQRLARLFALRLAHPEGDGLAVEVSFVDAAQRHGAVFDEEGRQTLAPAGVGVEEDA